METEKEQLEALQDIRKMMKDSSRFLSLSGFSGVLAGVFAFIGAWLANNILSNNNGTYAGLSTNSQLDNSTLSRLSLIGLSVLVLSISFAVLFSRRKALKNNHKLFDHTSKKLLWSMFVPLATGGIMCLALLLHGGEQLLLICPVMLIFYGLALFSSSRLTLHDVKYLGYMQIALGIAACFFPEHGLMFWTLGFGLLHIIYGSIMWYKYDRAKI